MLETKRMSLCQKLDRSSQESCVLHGGQHLICTLGRQLHSLSIIQEVDMSLINDNYSHKSAQSLTVKERDIHASTGLISLFCFAPGIGIQALSQRGWMSLLIIGIFQGRNLESCLISNFSLGYYQQVCGKFFLVVVSSTRSIIFHFWEGGPEMDWFAIFLCVNQDSYHHAYT